MGAVIWCRGNRVAHRLRREQGRSEASTPRESPPASAWLPVEVCTTLLPPTLWQMTAGLPFLQPFCFLTWHILLAGDRPFHLRALCRPKPPEWTLNIWSAQHQASIILQFLMAHAGRRGWRTEKKGPTWWSASIFLHVADRISILEEGMMGGIAVNVAKRAEWGEIFRTSSDLCR